MKRLSKQGLVLVLLSAALLAGIGVGVVRRMSRGEVKIQAASQAPLRIPLNQAGQEDLTRLPGIGPELASRIVEYRDTHGPYPHPDSLANVEGIGEATLTEIKPYLEVP